MVIQAKLTLTPMLALNFLAFLNVKSPQILSLLIWAASLNDLTLIRSRYISEMNLGKIWQLSYSNHQCKNCAERTWRFESAAAKQKQARPRLTQQKLAEQNYSEAGCFKQHRKGCDIRWYFASFCFFGSFPSHSFLSCSPFRFNFLLSVPSLQ